MKRTKVMLAIAFATLLPAGVSRAETCGPITGFESITYRPRYDRPALYALTSGNAASWPTICSLSSGLMM